MIYRLSIFSGISVPLKILYITSVFPTHPEDKRSCYIWDSINVLRLHGIIPIVLVTKSWQPKWAGKIHTDFLFEMIDRDKFPVEIHICRPLSIPRHHLRFLSNFFYLWRVVPVAKRLMKLHRIDLIHAHGEIAALAAAKLPKRFVVTLHGYDTCPRMHQGLGAKMFLKAFNAANHVVFVGSSLQAAFQKNINHAVRCKIIYNGCRIPERNTTHVDFKILQIISVGNLHEGKGVDITLRALGKLKKSNTTNFFYNIIGSGYQKSFLEKIILEENLTDHVFFTGDLPHDLVYQHLQQAHIFCLPSYREAFGIVYLEAMAHELLTIGVKNQGPSAFIDHGKTGFLVEPQSVDSVFHLLKKIFSSLEAFLPIAKHGSEHVRSHFTWEAHAKQLLCTYQDVLRKHS